MDTRKLRALIRMLRECGVTEYSADGVTVKLGAAPTSPRPARSTHPKPHEDAALSETEPAPAPDEQDELDLLLSSSGSAYRPILRTRPEARRGES